MVFIAGVMWMRVKLEDVCERGSSNIKQSDIIKMRGNYPIYGASGLVGKVNFYHQEQPYVAVVKDGAGIGRTTLNPAKSSVIGTMQYLIPKKNVLPEYLFYVVSYMHLEKYYTGATIPHIYFKDYKNEEFNLDNIEKQLEIIEVLGRCKKVIEARKQELVELDRLTKARFVEMFGTLDIPTQAFEKATLKELCNKITDGKHGGCKSEVGTERYFVGAREIYDDDVHYESAPEINIEEFEKDYKRCNVEIGDFLIVNTGATIGKSAIACDKRTEHTLLQKSVALLKVKKDVLNPIFLKWCYRVNTKMYMVENASAQPNLLLSKINATVIYVPDIELQNQFADFVHQVDKSKFDTMTFAPIYAIINLYLHTYFYQGRR